MLMMLAVLFFQAGRANLTPADAHDAVYSQRDDRAKNQLMLMVVAG